MADRRRKQKGSAKHAGIVLKKRVLASGAVSWRGRYRDPDTGETKYETLPAEDSATDEQRRAWAKRRVRELTSRAIDLDKGAARKKGALLTAVVGVFFDDITRQKRPATIKTYRKGADALLAFAAERGVTKADDLKPEHLAAFREWLANRPRTKKHGEGEAGGNRSGFTINSELRGVKVALNHLRRQALLPFVTSDALKDNLKPVATPKEAPEHLETAQLRALLAAVRRHDSETFEITREEKDGPLGAARRLEELRRAKARAAGKAVPDAPLPGGATPRFDPIAPYVLVLLLSGMRAAEARTLKWAQVDLDAAPAGRIKLTSATKTRSERIIDLTVSPALRALLRAMKLAAGDDVYVFQAPDAAVDDEGKPRPAAPLADTTHRAAHRRLLDTYGAPKFTWQTLRATCATYLTNAGGIFGAASAYRSAKQLGHSVAVAERFYLGQVHVDPKARTLETAMGVEAEVSRFVAALGCTAPPAASTA